MKHSVQVVAHFVTLLLNFRCLSSDLSQLLLVSFKPISKQSSQVFNLIESLIQCFVDLWVLDWNVLVLLRH